MKITGHRCPLGEIATGAIAHFSGPLSLLFLVVEYSPRPRHA